MRTDNEDDFLLGSGGGGSSPQRIARHAHQQFSVGGLEISNQLILPPDIQTIGPQYTVAPEYEELRRRYQLEAQQEINLCRRLMEEQQYQLLSESEYRNNSVQRLHDIHALQAHQDQRQDLSQFLARELDQHHEQQQQQYQREQLLKQQALRDNNLMAFLRDDFLFQQRHQHVQQPQQLQGHLSHGSHQREQEELLAALQACGNLSGVLPADIASLVSSLRPSEMMARHHPSTTSPMQRTALPPTLDSSQAYVEHFLDNSARQLSEYIPGLQDYASNQTDVKSSKPSSPGGIDVADNTHAPQDPPQSPKTKTSQSSDPSLTPIAHSNGIDEHGDIELEGEGQRQQKKSVSPIKTKAKVALNKRSVKNKKDPLVGSKVSKVKKSSISAGKIGTKARAGDRHGTARKWSAAGVSDSNPPPSTEVCESEDQPDSKKDSLANEAAADILLGFQRGSVSESEVQMAKKWCNNSRNSSSFNPEFLHEDIIFLSPGVKFNLPSLPIELELTELDVADMSLINNEHSDIDLTPDKTTGITSSLTSQPFPPVDNTGDHLQCRRLRPKRPGKDSWWPSNDSIREERQQNRNTRFDEDTDAEIDTVEDSETRLRLVRAGVKAVEQRMKSKEPGVLEKLPHCKLYDDFCAEKKQDDFTPLFCCQTTEIFPFDVMVCCSVCSTWRHAQCGGHYKHYTAECVDSSCIEFVPLCDQCFIEKQLIKNNPSGAKYVEQQRTDHLRRCNATNAVMRQFFFAKHSRQCKWPLGSVPISQFSGHIRNVQARHEKAEKQWKEMTARLGSKNNMTPSERQRARTKELERLLVCIEDAEGAMDRHNMMLFLQNDTSRLHPVGFESPRRNIFDPEDDPVYIDSCYKPADQSKSANQSDNSMRVSQLIPTDLTARSIASTDVKPPENGSDNGNLMANQRQKCFRQGCNRIARFDSVFCSDSCGVSTLEADLLKTLKYASKLHPHALRS